MNDAQIYKTHAYADAFARFKTHMSEQVDTMAAVHSRIAPVPGPPRIKALSIGTGTGEIDFPLISALCPKNSTIELHCVEPNPAQAAGIRQRAQSHARMQPPPCIYETSFEEADLAEHTFDLVVASHSIYYFNDRLGMCRKVANTLAPEGRFLLTVNEPEGVGQLHNFVLRQRGQTHHAYVGDNACQDLGSVGLTVKKHLVASHLDVSDVLQNGPDCDAILSIGGDIDATTMPPTDHQAMVDFVSSLAVQKDQRFLLPHNVALIEARLPAT